MASTCYKFSYNMHGGMWLDWHPLPCLPAQAPVQQQLPQQRRRQRLSLGTLPQLLQTTPGRLWLMQLFLQQPQLRHPHGHQWPPRHRRSSPVHSPGSPPL